MSDPLERASPAAIAAHQLERLSRLLGEVLPGNGFWVDRLGGAGERMRRAPSWERFRALPLTGKAELVADQEEHPPLGRIATYPRERYVAFHQTSGTHGRPLAVLDTAESWRWWSDCWGQVYRAAGVTAADRIFVAFGFGPFIGFWSAFAGAQALGALTIPGGGLDARQRLQLMRETGATVLVCTVTYALRLAEAAGELGIDLPALGIRRTIHAGEPGASIPSVRARVEQAYGAACFDHAGATEVGAYAFSCDARDGLHVNEAEFIAEIVGPGTETPVAEGETGELVVTNLGRPGWPVIRYRTGDLAAHGGRGCVCGRSWLKVPGGIAGRVDDLMIVRGVNVYPSAVEAVVRRFAIGEFRMVRLRRGALEELRVDAEASEETARALAEELRLRLSVRIETRAVPAGSLPRFELKARRIVDQRS
ncbi:MAG TPA: AMP-binding protein [Vicinamibacteria bacterium]|nr:AMP-binding protein [Vicinamibacteria bacterium]